ncbi:MAG: chemotaxis protein CheX [Magnetococcales bacterium]|nr:chemotaxis protein CheX [Magnetococcales bacterium]
MDTDRASTDPQRNLIHAIRDTMHETALAFFATDIGIQVGPAMIQRDGQPFVTPQADVTAMVAFHGGMNGGVHISAPMHAAVGLASAFWGEPLESFNDTARDALGELTNIIAGALKSRINDDINLTPPRVLEGAERAELQSSSQASTRCYFMTTNGPLFVEVFQDREEG